MDTYNGLFTSYSIKYGCLLLGDEAIYYAKWMISLDVIMTMLLSNQWNFYLLHTSHITKTVSSSDVAIIDVCIYSGIRFAPIYVPNYASSVRITIFFL